MDNPEKQTTQGRQDEENTTKTQHYNVKKSGKSQNFKVFWKKNSNELKQYNPNWLI
jgi:carbohydrate-binding DOMON domain-containing protein